jgi:Mlc titration factor MtfA (ptsG expression regulator)
MEFTVWQGILGFVLVVIIIMLAYKISIVKETVYLPENYQELLTDYVKFYRNLDEEGKTKFEKRIEHFLSAVKITGVNAVTEDLDRLLIASGAIIPVFAISDWQYINLHEVLLYPGDSMKILTRVVPIARSQGWWAAGPCNMSWSLRNGN